MFIATFQAGWLSLAWTVAGMLGGGLFLAWALISGFRKRSLIATDQLNASRAELVEVTKQEAQTWRSRFEAEHEEHAEYRKKTHDRNQEAQALVLRLTTENAELTAKTDLTPVLNQLKAQAEINTKVARSLEAVLQHLEKRNGHPAPPLR